MTGRSSETPSIPTPLEYPDWSSPRVEGSSLHDNVGWVIVVLCGYNGDTLPWLVLLSDL